MSHTSDYSSSATMQHGADAKGMDPASPQAQAVEQVASQIEDVAAKLRTADIGEIAGQATDMARRNPWLFIGGAAIAGFTAARFLKARDPEETTQHAEDDPWSPCEREDHSHGAVLSKINGGRSDA